MCIVEFKKVDLDFRCLLHSHSHSVLNEVHIRYSTKRLLVRYLEQYHRVLSAPSVSILLSARASEMLAHTVQHSVVLAGRAYCKER